MLSLGAQAPFGLRRDDLIVKDVAPAVLRRGLDTYHAWKTATRGCDCRGTATLDQRDDGDCRRGD